MASARAMPGVCGVLVSSSPLRIMRNPHVFQSGSVFEFVCCLLECESLMSAPSLTPPAPPQTCIPLRAPSANVWDAPGHLRYTVAAALRNYRWRACPCLRAIPTPLRESPCAKPPGLRSAPDSGETPPPSPSNESCFPASAVRVRQNRWTCQRNRNYLYRLPDLPSALRPPLFETWDPHLVAPPPSSTRFAASGSLAARSESPAQTAWADNRRRRRRIPAAHLPDAPARLASESVHNSFFAQRSRYIEAALPGKHHVENHGVKAFAFFDQALQRRFAVGSDLDRVPFGLQIKAQAIREGGLVFDDQHAAHATVTFLGNSRVTVVPLPAPSLSANPRPPCLRAIERTINNPSPVPFTCDSERCVTR